MRKGGTALRQLGKRAREPRETPSNRPRPAAKGFYHPDVKRVGLDTVPDRRAASPSHTIPDIYYIFIIYIIYNI